MDEDAVGTHALRTEHQPQLCAGAVQLERPHLVKFWLGVLIRHLRSDEPLMVRHALTTLVWFFWHFTCFALPRYLVRPFQEAVCLISERVAEGTPPGLARMPDPLVNSPFRHLPDTPPLREKVVSMNNRFVAMMQLIKRDECGMRVVCPPGMFQGPSDAASVAAGKEDVLDAVRIDASLAPHASTMRAW